MRTPSVMAALVSAFFLSACATPSNCIADYLSGFQAPSASSPQPPRATEPIIAGVVLALPETEIGKQTTPSPDTLEKVAGRIQKELQGSSAIVIQRILPPITIPGSGLAGLSLERLRGMAKEEKLTHVVVAVVTSRTASKMRFSTVQETQLYARIDAALVDLSTGRILATESGQDDYVLAETLYYYGYSYPRIYYRTFTFGGPFTVVEGNPQQALGWASFKGAADQLGMKLRQRLALSSPAYN